MTETLKPKLRSGARVRSLINDGANVTVGLEGTVFWYSIYNKPEGNMRAEVHWDNECNSKMLPTEIEVIGHSHVVWVTDRRVDCTQLCAGNEPHLHEHRAADRNPNPPPAPETAAP